MASSSVSLDDIDNDFEKNSRRSRIRTARARAHLRLESGGDRSGATCSGGIVMPGGDCLPPLESANIDRPAVDKLHELADSVSSVIGISNTASEFIEGGDSRPTAHFHSGNAPGISGDSLVLSGKSMNMLQLRALNTNGIERETIGSQRIISNADRANSTDRTGPQAVFIPTVSGCISGIPEGHETSPKPGVIRTGKDKSYVRNKLHHVNKGKPQRDRRKLREKRRSSGVVHLASTESTGGSTTGDDEGSSDACIAHLEDRHIPNQHQQFPVSCIPSSSYGGAISSNLANYHMTTSSTTMTGDIRKKMQDSSRASHLYSHEDSQDQINHMPSGNISSSLRNKSTVSFGDLASNGASSSTMKREVEDSRMSQAFYDEAVKVNATHSRAPHNCLANSNSNIGIRGASKCRRDKSPSDLEADDENDHDSLNQSETGSGSNVSVCNVGLPSSINASGKGASTSSGFGNSQDIQNHALGYMNLPEPTLGDINIASRENMSNVTDIVEENKRLMSLMEEKDRRIHLLEYKVQQLMRDTLTISEEQSRLQKENSTLLRALSKLTMNKDKHSKS